MPGRIFYPSVFNPPGSFTTANNAPRGWECVDPDTTRRLRPIQPQGEVLCPGAFAGVTPPVLVTGYDPVYPSTTPKSRTQQPQAEVLPPGLFGTTNTTFGGEVFAPAATRRIVPQQPQGECWPPGQFTTATTRFGGETFAPAITRRLWPQQPQGETLPLFVPLYVPPIARPGWEVVAPQATVRPSRQQPAESAGPTWIKALVQWFDVVAPMIIGCAARQQPVRECLPPGVYYASNTLFGGEAFAPATTPKARTQQPQGECLPPGLFSTTNTAFGGEVFAPVGLPKPRTQQPQSECLPPGLFSQVNTTFGGAEAMGPLVTRRPRGQQQPAGETLPPGKFATVIIVALKTVGSWICGGLARGWIAGGTKRTWYYGGPMASVLVNNTLQKATGDTVRFGLDLGDLPEIVTGGQTILSVIVTSLPTGLTIGTPGIDAGGYSVSAVFSGGTAGQSYDVAWTVTLSNSLISRTGVLNVL